jgi:drug/metabolite transporter (DMT)-like permease
MWDSEALAVVYGLASAASWGAGDFSGGLATRRENVYRVVMLSQVIGGVLLLGVVLWLGEPLPPRGVLIIGGIAGLCGALGLMALYQGLARGRMGVVAPVAAIVTAVLPVGTGILREGWPSLAQLAGFALALVAVWLLAGSGTAAHIQPEELRLAVTAGVGFGLFLVFIDRVSSTAILWPLVGARVASVSLLSVVVLARRGQISSTPRPWRFIALAGIGDSGGNAFFALASRAGRLDIAAVLGSLYPAATVLLAWLVLHERLEHRQWAGVAAALVALGLIAL